MAARDSLARLRHILNLCAFQARMNTSVLFSDWQNFIACSAAGIFSSIAGLAGVFLLAERFQGLGQWSQPQVVFMLGYAMLVQGLTEMFGNDTLYISRRIGRGQIDHNLVQPLPLLTSVLFSEGFVSMTGLPAMLAGLGLLGWSIHSLHLPLSASWLCMAILNVVASAAVTFGFAFTLGSICFWGQAAGEGLSDESATFMYELKPFPLDGLGSVLTLGLLTALPVGFVAWYPSRYLLGFNGSTLSGWATPLAAVAICLFGRWLFYRGLTHYVREGSQRYSASGFRH